MVLVCRWPRLKFSKCLFVGHRVRVQQDVFTTIFMFNFNCHFMQILVGMPSFWYATFCWYFLITFYNPDIENTFITKIAGYSWQVFILWTFLFFLNMHFMYSKYSSIQTTIVWFTMEEIKPQVCLLHRSSLYLQAHSRKTALENYILKCH